MEVYIDDMLVKLARAWDHFQHLSETFEILRKYNMKLNPKKCAFGVATSKFLRFLVSNRGIKVNPTQIKVIEEISDVLISKKKYGILPEDKKKSQLLRMKAARYCLIEGNLYRNRGPLAWCLGPSQTEYMMREVHVGHCGNHAGRRSQVKTLRRAGYYWPKMKDEAEKFIARCDKCQRYANNMHRLAELLNSIISLWPFMKWGMDILGPLPQASGKIRRIKRQVAKSATGVLWAYRITTKIRMGETSFSLIYGTKALIPVEKGEPSTRYTHANEESNEEELRTNFDLTEERREAALVRMAAQKQRIE
nr:uncharacterized protein LOC117274010 [Nicotiana tomentosiformis]